MAKKETIIIELDFDTSDFTKDAAKLNKEISELNKQQKQLKKSGEEGSIQYQKNTEALRENKKSLRETNKTIDQLNTANKATAGSNEQLRAQLSILTKEYNGLSEAERKNGARGKELNTQINQTTATLKENEEGIGDNRRSVGDYGKALSGTPFGSFIGGIKSMGAAFLANPIGLIITAIVAALALLKKAFTASEDGENKLGKATAVLSTMFDRLLDLLGPLADFIADSVGKAFDDLGKAVELVSKGIEKALSFLGFEGAAEGLKNYRAESEKALKGAIDVADARAKADIIERNLLVERSKAEGKIAKLRLKAKQEDSVSAAERKKALLEARDLEDGLLVKEQEVLKLRFEAQKQENTFAKSNKENLNKAAELEAELNRNITERANSQRTIQRELNTVNAQVRTAEKKRASEKKAEIQKEIDSQKLALNLFIESHGVRAKTINEQLKISEQVAQKKIDILKGELDAKLINEKQYELAVLQIQNEQLLQQTEAVVENAQRELDIITKANESKIEANQFLNDELYAQEIERQNKTLEAQLEFEALRLEQGVVSQEEYNNAINGINEENAIALEELAIEKAEADEEQRIVDLELRREIAFLEGEEDFEFQREQLELQRIQEVENAKATGNDIEQVNKKFALLDAKIDKAKFNNKLDIASQTFGNLAAIAGKESNAGKAIAIAQTTIDTYKGATAAFAALAGVGPVGPVLGAIAAAAAIAAGVANVRKIASTQPAKAAKGGIFGGRLHSEGGTKGYFDDGTQIEVEKGELFAVVNRNSTGMLNDLSNLNQAGGGVSFGMGGTKSFFQDGGIAIDNVSGSVNSDLDATLQIVEAVESLPAPVVVVQDINEVQGETISVEQRAII